MAARRNARAEGRRIYFLEYPVDTSRHDGCCDQSIIMDYKRDAGGRRTPKSMAATLLVQRAAREVD